MLCSAKDIISEREEHCERFRDSPRSTMTTFGLSPQVRFSSSYRLFRVFTVFKALPPTRGQPPGRPNAPWVGYGGARAQTKCCVQPGTPLPRWLSTLGASETVQVCFGGRTGWIFGSAGLYFSYLQHCVTAFGNAKSSEISALMKRREAQLQKNVANMSEQHSWASCAVGRACAIHKPFRNKKSVFKSIKSTTQEGMPDYPPGQNLFHSRSKIASPRQSKSGNWMLSRPGFARVMSQVPREQIFRCESL